MDISQYVFGPDMIRDFEARLGSGQEQDKSGVMYDLVEEHIASISKKLHMSPSISVNMLPHTHLINYGGAYYSYLFAKMHASQIWHHQFSEDPLSR